MRNKTKIRRTADGLTFFFFSFFFSFFCQMLCKMYGEEISKILTIKKKQKIQENEKKNKNHRITKSNTSVSL
jgi:hypothetical protein